MKLAAWRQRAGLTQEQVAARLGVIPVTVARYEAGARLPGPEIMKALYELTDGAVEPNDFYALPALRGAAEAA